LYQYSSKAKKKKIFISFNYDDDKDYRYLLSALNANTGSEIEFEDYTPSEINSLDVGQIKRVLRRKIREADYTLAVIGKGANSYHRDREEIGYRNWQWWEIEKAAEDGHKFIAVKIKSEYEPPDPLYGKKATWARSYKVDSIVKAIKDA